MSPLVALAGLWPVEPDGNCIDDVVLNMTSPVKVQPANNARPKFAVFNAPISYQVELLEASLIFNLLVVVSAHN